MLGLVRSVYAPLFYAFKFVCYPFDVVLRFIGRGWGAWRPSTRGTEVLDQDAPSKYQTTEYPPDAFDVPDQPPNTTVAFSLEYYPPGASKVIGRGSWCYIGLVDESTVLKYPKHLEEGDNIQVKAQLLEIVGSHPRIIKSHGLTEHGLLLQYAPKGNLSDYFAENPDIPLEQKLRWCKQAAEAVDYIHEKNILHCDINSRNFLLDSNLDLLLADFQGVLLSTDGKALLDGQSRESSKYHCPRVIADYAEVKTDIFALGSTIYFILMSHEVFPELISWEQEEEVEARFSNGQFPTDSHICSKVTAKCWQQCYESARDVIFDLSQIQLS
ncbi:hypothetical protein PENFLA_c030G04835 [Penicillium flavigenum]|uniref:Protein kinase domain-containing protein n=1 Tax=Penicillium flavigenum TaxID=254877 RepID=A0A1V6SP39_9EURO|nr:hypothetical protein PENFLA_c030G04835 [Penicillium flavigenum]